MTFGSVSFPRPPPLRQGGTGNDALSPTPFHMDGDFAVDELERMAHACVHSLGAALDVVHRWREAGHGLEAIYVHGIAPCARLLGHWWTCDNADFAHVTIASTNLQRLLHHLSPEFCAPGADRPCGLSLLLATEPQSQHTMGAYMLGEFFRRRGWAVQRLTPQDNEDVLRPLRGDWFDAVGLSVSTGRQLHALRDLLPRLRSESPNDRLCVLVGGPLAHADPDALQMQGVDLVGGSALETVNALHELATVRKN